MEKSILIDIEKLIDNTVIITLNVDTIASDKTLGTYSRHTFVVIDGAIWRICGLTIIYLVESEGVEVTSCEAEGPGTISEEHYQLVAQKLGRLHKIIRGSGEFPTISSDVSDQICRAIQCAPTYTLGSGVTGTD